PYVLACGIINQAAKRPKQRRRDGAHKAIEPVAAIRADQVQYYHQPDQPVDEKKYVINNLRDSRSASRPVNLRFSLDHFSNSPLLELLGHLIGLRSFNSV